MLRIILLYDLVRKPVDVEYKLAKTKIDVNSIIIEFLTFLQKVVFQKVEFPGSYYT